MLTRSLNQVASCLVILGVFTLSCSDTNSPNDGAGGGSTSSSTGGRASGGTTTSFGDKSGSGGTSVTGAGGGSGGAVPATGGMATGGASTSTGGNASGGGPGTGGGILGTGGRATAGSTSGVGVGGGPVPATGGARATAGANSGVGGAHTGGSPSGGAATTGGMSTAGRASGGQVSTAGQNGSGGNGGHVVGGASPGCGSGKTTSSCSKSGATKCTLTSNSKAREYYLILPTNYNPSKAYPVVIMLHGMIATAEMALSWFKEIPTNMPDAIYIAPQGLKHKEQGGGANGNEVTGWANVDGEDIQFMKDLLGATQKDYCVDAQRAFAVGFSYGAMFSYAIGCELGGIFRAIAPMSGAIMSGCNLSGKPVAMWGSHGTSDSLVPIASGRQARDKILQQNHCGAQTIPVDPSPCVAYQGCDEGYPVTWCEWDGDHNRPPFGNTAVAAFFKQF
jgi:polyhydroxybutyrate depolymerase